MADERLGNRVKRKEVAQALEAFEQHQQVAAHLAGARGARRELNVLGGGRVDGAQLVRGEDTFEARIGRAIDCGHGASAISSAAEERRQKNAGRRHGERGTNATTSTYRRQEGILRRSTFRRHTSSTPHRYDGCLLVRKNVCLACGDSAESVLRET